MFVLCAIQTPERILVTILCLELNGVEWADIFHLFGFRWSLISIRLRISTVNLIESICDLIVYLLVA